MHTEPDTPPRVSMSASMRRLLELGGTGFLVLVFLLVSALVLAASNRTPANQPSSHALAGGTTLLPAASATDASSPTATWSIPTQPPPPTPWPTPTTGVYHGPNYMSVTNDPSSCHPGANSPYPYLDVSNTSPDTALFWQVSISSSAYSLWKSPPSPIDPHFTDLLDFVGPMTAPDPLQVALTGSIGSWSGSLRPCSVQVPPNPTTAPTPTTAPPPTPTPLPLTVTCAQAVANTSGQLCVHTLPGATVSVDSVGYCSGNGESSASLFGTRIADANGNYTWTWVPHTTCIGQATAVISGSWYDSAHGIWYRGSVTTTFMVQ